MASSGDGAPLHHAVLPTDSVASLYSSLWLYLPRILIAKPVSTLGSSPRACICGIHAANAPARHRRLPHPHVSPLHMRWSKHGKGEGPHGPGAGPHAGPRGYHHGNLKEALIRAALDLIAAKGPAGFTLRRPRAGPASVRPRRTGISATATNCSPTWPGAASIGSRPRCRRLERRPARPVHRLRALGRAYLAFARDEPAYYSAMFEAGVPLERDPRLRRPATAPSPCCAAARRWSRRCRRTSGRRR